MIPTAFPFRPLVLSARGGLRALHLCVLALALAGPAIAAVTPDSTPKDWPADPKKHQVTIRREAKDDTERRLIATAEAAPPPADDVRKAAGEATLPDTEKLWWYKEELGLRIPYAITGDAVAYYTNLVKTYAKQTFNRYVAPSSAVEYQAGVKAHAEFTHDGKSFRDVRVVTLKLTFTQNFCATGTEGMSFTKERVVILDATGKVLHIAGDGPTETPILAI